MKKVIFSLLLLLGLAHTSVSHASLEDGDLFCFYSKTNFKGEKVCGKQKKINWVGWRWYNRISSIEVKEGHEIIAFRYARQYGASTIFRGKVADLGKWRGRIWSFYIKPTLIEQDKVCFYSLENFRGERFCSNKSFRYLNWFWNNKISSVTVPNGFEVQLYRYGGFYGGSIRLRNSARRLGYNKKLRATMIKTVKMTVHQDQC